MNNQFFNLFKRINISNIAGSTSNTLKVIKKIIPLYKEVKPYIYKEKKIIEIKESTSEKKEELSSYDNSITFFN